MDAHVARYVARGQYLLLFFLIVCVAVHPGFVLKRDEGGLSNYGAHLKTAIPYSLAFLCAAWCSFRAMVLLDPVDDESRILRWILQWYAVGLLLILLSSYIYKASRTLVDLHVGINIIEVLFETAAAVWMYRICRSRRVAVTGLGMEFAGFVLGALTITNVVQLIFVSELVTAVGFGILLISGSRSIVDARV